MKNITKLLLVAGLLLGLAMSGLNFTGSVAAHDGEVHADEMAQADTGQNASDTYVYEAQPGDTYTQIARKAIQTYGIENSVNLSGAEIIFAETRLTREAGSPALNVGQQVSVSKETVKKWVEEAQKLDEATEARWNKFVAFVDFNTNNIGEKRSVV